MTLLLYMVLNVSGSSSSEIRTGYESDLHFVCSVPFFGVLCAHLASCLVRAVCGPLIAAHQCMRLGFCWSLSAVVMTLAMQPLAIATQSFAANPLFRGCKAKDPAFLAAALHDGRALLVKGQTVAMQGDELVWIAVNSTADSADCYLLGQMRSEGWHAFTVDVSAAPELAAQHSFVNIRKLLATSSNLETVALAGQASALAAWHASCKFCGGCGQPTAAIEAGLKRACSACKRRFYSRTDPCVNVLVVSPDGQKILLGRRAGAAPATRGGGVYSNLAGFVEQGESVEECAGMHHTTHMHQ
jgi:NADH pyrophosphatase zinc ribbon domain/NADH pyrophosphatase-like rudimentary NUDIX domain